MCSNHIKLQMSSGKQQLRNFNEILDEISWYIFNKVTELKYCFFNLTRKILRSRLCKKYIQRDARSTRHDSGRDGPCRSSTPATWTSNKKPRWTIQPSAIIASQRSINHITKCLNHSSGPRKTKIISNA